jgi:hypothetical protein
MTGEMPLSVRELLIMWRRRAQDREDSAHQQWGMSTIEERIMAADAAAVRQCIAELEQVDEW